MMKQKTKVALNAFACGSLFFSLTSAIMHDQSKIISSLVLMALFFSAIIFIKAYSNE